jgi:hypothetical protein
MNAAEIALRKARLLHAGFFLASILYVLIPLVAIKTETKEVNPLVVGAFFLIAISDLGIATFLRGKMVKSAAETLAQNSEDAGAAAKWSRGVLLSLVFCMSTILLGLVLRILGASWNVCGVFFIAGILLLLAWMPKLDLPSSCGS